MVILNELQEQLKKLLLKKENSIWLVKDVKFPPKYKRKRKIDRKREIEFNPKEVIKIVAELFYEKGAPVPVREIIKKFHLEKAGKFGDRVLKPLSRNAINAIKFVKSGKARGAPNHFYPSAVVLRFERDEILDPTTFPSFYKTLEVFSDVIKVNLCNHTLRGNEALSLSEFLSRFERKDIAMHKLIELAKQHPEGKDFCAGFSTCKLREEIFRQVLAEEFGKEVPYTRIGDLCLEFKAWFGNGEIEFTYGDIICEYDEKETLQLPEELQAIVEKIIEKKKEEAKIKKQTYDDDPLYRLVGVKLERPVIQEIKNRKQRLHLFLGPTNFFPYSATNLMLKEITLKDKDGNPISLLKRSVEGKNLSNATSLQESKLPNPLGVALAVLTNDEPPKIVLHKRSEQAVMGPGKYSLPAEKMLRGVDIDFSKVPPEPSPFITAKRCLWDELHVEVEKEDIKFLVLGIRLDYLQPQLLGVVKLKISGEEFLKMKDMARDKWEASGTRLKEFSLNEELKGILTLEESKISSTAKATIIYALINRYGLKRVDDWLTTKPLQTTLRSQNPMK